MRRLPQSTPPWARLAACMALLAMVTACGGGHPAKHARAPHNPTRYYPPPGPREDPWAPYIHEAAARFTFPEPWIRQVMHQESGGQEDVISWAGAMGLMQVMPDTYDSLRGRYALGDDPFDPHNNILAGTAYLKEMYDRFGAPGFLAAYNAGPNRLDRYLNNGTPLPSETVNYVASIAPLLGSATPMSGPLAAYAGGTAYALRTPARPTPSGCDPDAAYNPNAPCTPLRPMEVQPVVVAALAFRPPGRPTPAGCDPDAAYNPSGPCTPLRPTEVQPVVVAAAEPMPAYTSPRRQTGCDPDAAYDPTRPCQPLPELAVAKASAQARIDYAAHSSLAQQSAQDRLDQERPRSQPSQYTMRERPDRQAAQGRPWQESVPAWHAQEKTAQSVAFVPWSPPGRWAIQVGAYANLATAQTAAENARSALPDLLRTAKVELPPTTPFGNHVAFRARLFGLTATAASDACAKLSSRGAACITISPSQGSS